MLKYFFIRHPALRRRSGQASGIRYLPVTLSLFLTMILSFSCQKDNPGGGLANTSAYRITEWLAYEDGIQDFKAEVSYEGSKVKQILGYDYSMKDQWRLSSKHELSYPEVNKAINTCYTFNPTDSIWSLEFKEEVLFDGNDVVEYKFISWNPTAQKWVPVSRITSTYDNGLLMEETYFSFISQSETWENDEKYVFQYSDGTLTNVDWLFWNEPEWTLVSQYLYEYRNGQLDWIRRMHGDQGVWDTIAKEQLSWNGDLLEIANRYARDFGGWVLRSNVNYAYDSEGNVTGWLTTYLPGGSTTRMQFDYEAGQGNFKQVMFTSFNESLDWYLPYPTASAIDQFTNLHQLTK